MNIFVTENLITNMKLTFFTAALLFFVSVLYAQQPPATSINQYALIDKKASNIPDTLTHSTTAIAAYISSNFKTDLEKLRAIFIWIASNVQYDIDNMFAIDFYEKEGDKIVKVLKTKKGICGDYAALFKEISLKTGIHSLVVTGYTRQNGFTDYIPHAWNAAMIDSSWFLFDATWGSGYVNGGKFYKKINSNYFKAQPGVFIKSHMPFDYLWQFLKYPVSNQEFIEGKFLQNKNKSLFNFTDSIEVFKKQSNIDKLYSSVQRIEKNGIKHSLIFDQLRHLKLEIENYKQTQIVNTHNGTVNLYNSAVAEYNAGISGLVKFVDYRNKKFTPAKPDAEIQAMIDSAHQQLNHAKIILQQTSTSDKDLSNLVSQLNKQLEDAFLNVKEQQEWLTKYFSKGKLARKSMFYKYTWFGVPLN